MFVLDIYKCAKCSVVRGKVVSSSDVSLLDGSTIHHLGVGETYKYLGFFEAEGVDCVKSKKLIMDLYHHRLRLIWNSFLSGPRKTRATNSFYVPVLSYGFGIIPWTKKEIEQFDVSTRKTLTATCNHHPRSAVERLYLSRSVGGIGLINVENLFFRRLVVMAHHLSTSSDSLVQLCYELDCLLPPYPSVLTRARNYCATLSVACDLQCCELSSLKSTICERQSTQLMSSLIAKPLHGQFYSLLSNDLIDRHRSLCWLRHHLHSETESTVFAVQNQVICTRVIAAKIMHKTVPSVLCRVCGQSEETIVHLLAACPLLAASAYLYRHNLVAGALHWHLMKVYSIRPVSKSWFTHKPPPVVETPQVKILWDFSLVSENHHLSNRPDIVIFDYLKQLILFVEVSCPADINVPCKEQEKLRKYRPLARDFHLMYKMPVELVPVVLGCTGVVSTGCINYLQRIPGFTDGLFDTLQKAVLIGSVHTLRTLDLTY